MGFALPEHRLCLVEERLGNRLIDWIVWPTREPFSSSIPVAPKIIKTVKAEEISVKVEVEEVLLAESIVKIESLAL